MKYVVKKSVFYAGEFTPHCSQLQSVFPNQLLALKAIVDDAIKEHSREGNVYVWFYKGYIGVETDKNNIKYEVERID